MFEDAGKGWTVESALTDSGSATVVFTGFVADHDYMVCAYGIDPSADMNINAVYGTGGTPTYQTANYVSSHHGVYGTTAIGTSNNVDAEIQIIGGAGSTDVGGAADEEVGFTFEILNPGDSAEKTFCFWQSICQRADTNAIMVNGGAYRDGDEAVTAIKFIASTGNFTSGKFKLYKRPNA